MRHGAEVAAFERQFAAYTGAHYAIACTNGTVSLEGALHACGAHESAQVRTTPLTMSATTIAALNLGCRVVYGDVDPYTWLLEPSELLIGETVLGVSLYGLHYGACTIDDAAQTLRPHNTQALFTSYSFQRSKILQLGEGGMLTTNDERLATRARSYLSLGYDMAASQSRIDTASLKSPHAIRHYLPRSTNGRMNDLTARAGLDQLERADDLKDQRQHNAALYFEAIDGCPWLTPQRVPFNGLHDYWCVTLACDTPERATWLSDRMAHAGGERPFAAWRLTYTEPAFRDLAPMTHLTHAESLQPRLVQLQTNDRASAERNATALWTAIRAVSG